MDRLDSDNLLKYTLMSVFNLPLNVVDEFIGKLTAQDMIELTNQRVSTLPVEVLDGLKQAIQYTSNDTSVDNMELGDDSLDSTVDMYAQHIDPKEEEEGTASYDSVKSLLSRLSGKCGCGGSLREYMDVKLAEMNDIDAEQTINNDATDGIDSATMRRIQALRDAGNDQAADNLLKQAAKRKIVNRNSGSRTPLDNTIKAQKRQLAQSIQRRNTALHNTNQPG